jgi:hypothetical protein
MKRNEYNLETFSYLILFGAAVLARTLLLGKAPLGSSEAAWAYQAWELAQGETGAVGVQVLYLTLTEMLFFLLGSSNFLARLIPALAGASLVWLPYLFRDQLGRKAALAAALGLALDPILVVSSRLAGGPVLAVLFVGLTAAFLREKRWGLAAAMAGFALYAGPSLWFGLLGLGLAVGLGYAFGIFPAPLFSGLQAVREDEAFPGRVPEVLLGLAFVLMVGTTFFQHPQGVSAWLKALPAFLAGWLEPSGVSGGQILLALVVYQPLALIFAGIAFIGLAPEEKNRAAFLGFWFLSSLLVIILYPGREVYHLAWSLVPLWGLAGRGVVKSLRSREQSWVIPVQAGLIVLVGSMIWFYFINMIPFSAPGEGIMTQWIVIGAAFLLALMITLIVLSEWSWPIARRGLTVGVLASLGVYLLAVLSGAAYVNPGDPREILYPDEGLPQLGLFEDTLQEFGLWETGRADELQVTVLNERPELRWVLRDYQNARFQEQGSLDTYPDVVIKQGTEDASLWSTTYRGQDFVLRTAPAWQGPLPADWKAWLAFREGPLQQEYTVLWLRRDVFPAGEGLGGESEEVLPREEEGNQPIEQ